MSDEKMNGELITDDDGQIDLNALIPLGVKLIENSNAQAQAQVDLQKEDLKIAERQLAIHESAFQHKYWLLVLITISLIGISIGLIFFKNETSTGISMLSHIGAVIVGIIAGSGWERTREK